MATIFDAIQDQILGIYRDYGDTMKEVIKIEFPKGMDDAIANFGKIDETTFNDLSHKPSTNGERTQKQAYALGYLYGCLNTDGFYRELENQTKFDYLAMELTALKKRGFNLKLLGQAIIAEPKYRAKETGRKLMDIMGV